VIQFVSPKLRNRRVQLLDHSLLILYPGLKFTVLLFKGLKLFDFSLILGLLFMKHPDLLSFRLYQELLAI
jgi:hypothetical protein